MDEREDAGNSVPPEIERAFAEQVSMHDQFLAAGVIQRCPRCGEDVGYEVEGQPRTDEHAPESRAFRCRSCDHTWVV